MELPLCLYFGLWFLSLTGDRPMGGERGWRAMAMDVLLWCALAMLVLTRPVFVLLVPVTVVALVIRGRAGLAGMVRVVTLGIAVVVVLGIVQPCEVR